MLGLSHFNCIIFLTGSVEEKHSPVQDPTTEEPQWDTGQYLQGTVIRKK